MRSQGYLLIACVLVVATTKGAQADNDDSWARGIADAINGEKIPIEGIFLAMGAGWEYPERVALHAETGYAWGTNDTGMMRGKSAAHLSVASSLSIDPGPRSVQLDLALLFGGSGVGVVSGGLAGGLEVHLGDNILAGPVAKLRAGYGSVVLYVQLGARLSRDRGELNLGVGLEYLRLP